MKEDRTEIWRQRRDYWRMAAAMSAEDSGARAIAERMARKYDRLLERSRRHEKDASEEQKD